MQNYKVSDLMVPLSEYATVGVGATLYEAVLALERAQEKYSFKHSQYRHRAVLVLDAAGKVVGKISQIDALKALEPRYEEILEGKGIQALGFTKKFLQTMLKEYTLFNSPLKDICRKAAQHPVTKFMHTPTEGEFVDLNTSLDEAIHQLVMGRHQSLLVTKGADIIGILRLTDVFTAVFHMMKQCSIEE